MGLETADTAGCARDNTVTSVAGPVENNDSFTKIFSEMNDQYQLRHLLHCSKN